MQSFSVFPANLGILYHDFEWKFDSALNKTKLSARVSNQVIYRNLRNALKTYISIIVHFTAIITIWICSVFLATALDRNTKSRVTQFRQTSADISHNRNKRAMKTVFLIATSYVVFSTPRLIINIAGNIYPNLVGTGGRYSRAYLVSIMVGVQLSLCNSSINILIYMYASSKFKQIVETILGLR